MEDVVYLVCYDGAHKTGILCATADQKKAIDEANKQQGFRIEKWVNGKMIQRDFYQGGKQERG